MIRIISILMLCFFVFTAETKAKKLEAYFSYNTFYAPTSGPFVEIYLSINGSSLKYELNENKNYNAEIEVTYIISKDDSVSTFKKFILKSPEIADSSDEKENLIDVQRFSIPNGSYLLDVSVKDNKVEKAPIKGTQKIELDYSESASISQIELLESFVKSDELSLFTKSGFKLTPYTSNYYSDVFNRLPFYAEIYNLNNTLSEDEPFLVKIYLKDYEKNLVLPEFMVYKRMLASKVNVILHEYSIEKLPSGNYNLVVEVVDKENNLIATQKQFLYRYNPSIKLDETEISKMLISNSFVEKMRGTDTLRNNILCLSPIADHLELSFIHSRLDSSNEDFQRKFILSFWKKRNELEPEREWLSYFEKVKYVERKYSFGNFRGYESDRGRVYLKYGKPNQISVRPNEPSSYPYEIWQYYKLKQRADVRFVFYNPSLASNDYELLHSNLMGEIKDYRWKTQLQRRDVQFNNLDDTQGIMHQGSRVDDLFENPR